MSSRVERGLVVVVGLLATAFFFRSQIGDGFNYLFSDRYDGFIEISLLEHWFNVFRGYSHPFVTNYFYPEPNTLGYNDGYFLYGLIYSVPRSLGADAFLSSELVNVVVRGIGYFGLYAALRRMAGLSRPWSMFGGVLFTISNGIFIHAVHQQLLSVSFVPVLAVLAWEMVAALKQNRRLRGIAYGAACVALYAALLMTAFYIAWFFAYFTLFFLAAWLLVSPWNAKLEIAGVIRRHVPIIILFGLLMAAGLYPFLALYGPKADETGMHGLWAMALFSPSVFDLVHVGDGNLIFGRADIALHHRIAPEAQMFTEHTTGFPLAILAVFLCAAVWSCRHRKDVPLALPVTLATLVSWVLLMHFGSFALYPFVYDYIPGGKAIRVIARYQLFVAAPVTALAVCFLARTAKAWPKWLLAALCLFLLAEEVNTAPILRINREYWVARFDRLAPPPAECRSFFVARVDLKQGYIGGRIEAIYLHSVDAMLIAELNHLPTVNGYATFQPRDYALFLTEEPDYLKRIKAYRDRQKLTGFCAVDLPTMTWAGPEEVERQLADPDHMWEPPQPKAD